MEKRFVEFTKNSIEDQARIPTIWLHEHPWRFEWADHLQTSPKNLSREVLILLHDHLVPRSYRWIFDNLIFGIQNALILRYDGPAGQGAQS